LEHNEGSYRGFIVKKISCKTNTFSTTNNNYVEMSVNQNCLINFQNDLYAIGKYFLEFVLKFQILNKKLKLQKLTNFKFLYFAQKCQNLLKF